MKYGFRSKVSCVDAIAAITQYKRNEIVNKAQDRACSVNIGKI